MVRLLNMSRKINSLAGLLLLAISLPFQPFQGRAAVITPPGTNDATKPSKPITLSPGPEDGRVAFLTAYLLQNHHYSQLRFDDDVSSRFLDSYLKALDSQHLQFLQSDLNEFETYRTNLDNLTLTRRGLADTKPAYVIINRYIERWQQRVDYVDELLKTEKFAFNTDERVVLDRRDAAYPRDINEARDLWRQRLRFEYLQEKLGYLAKSETATNGAAASKLKPKSKSPEAIHQEIVDKLQHRYYRTLKMFADWNNQDVLGVYLTALAHVYDPHSDYFNKSELDQFKISMNLQLFGIGAELRSEDGSCKIEKLLPGGPAIKSKKIGPGDHIVAVAQADETPVDVIDMPLTKVVQLIRGPKGTEVRLTVLPGGDKSSEPKIVTLIRDEIPLEDQAAKGSIIDLPNADGKTVRLGVINLPSFYAPMDPGAPVAANNGGHSDAHYTSADVAKLLKKFKDEGVTGVILDLRLNGGGVLEEAIKVAGLFIRKGPVVQARYPDTVGRKVEIYQDDDDGVAYDGPLVVLTSRFSASASEIVAGALQDYGRALIVGDSSTHGKGTVQTVTSLRPMMQLNDQEIDEPGALKFTIRKFYRASGASTQLKGVIPDVVLPSRWNESEDIGEGALDNPLGYDTIASASYEKLNLVQPYLSELLKRSTQRISTNQDFKYVHEDIEEFRKQQADKSVSLNEKTRLKEKEELESRQKARERELRARKQPDEKVYELTLKQADLPGLPEPVSSTNAVAQTGNSAAALLSVTAESGDDEDEKIPPLDAHLRETERILMDYVGLLPKDAALIVKSEIK